MIPRDKMKECFQCKNNLRCWKLDQGVPESVNEKETKWSTDSILSNIKRLQSEYDIEYAGDFLGLFAVLGLASLNKELDSDYKYKRESIFNIVFMFCALANTTNDGWYCPDGFTFEPHQPCTEEMMQHE